MAKRSAFSAVPVPLIKFLVSKVGLRGAVKVAAFVTAWGIATEKLGQEPNFREYSVFWGQSEAQTYKELKVFHDVWPDDRTPLRVWEWLESQVPSREREQAAAELLAARMAAQ